MDEEYDDVINDEYEETIESIQGENARTKKGHVIFEKVNHSDRAAKFKVLSDGEVAEYLNVALEYFNNRCALSGERFEKFKGKIDRKIGTNLSAEHVVALCQGGHDIVPNLVPSVLQYNISKNGYYLLEWWEKQKDINGKPIYSPYRLLKLVNFMIKSIDAREFSQGKDIKNYKKAIMTPNEIDEFLEQIEVEDELEIDNSKKKIFSETITATTLDENNKKILTQIPTIEGNMPSHSTQVKEREQIDERVMMDIFLTDAVKVLKQQLPNEAELHSKLNEKVANVVGEIPFEVNVRNIILQKLEKFRIEENKYSVANSIANSIKIYRFSERYEKIENKIEEHLNKYFRMLEEIGLSRQQIAIIISNDPGIIDNSEQLKVLSNRIKWYSEYKGIDAKEINVNFFNSVNFCEILDVKMWMDENNTTKPPRSTTTKDDLGEDERKLGNELVFVRLRLKKINEKLKTNEKIKKYIKQHPEQEEVIRIIGEIDKNNITSKYLEGALKIREWMNKKNTTKPPSSSSKNEEEKSLGKYLISIRSQLIKRYNDLKTEDEKREFERKHPELEEVMKIIEEIDKNNVRLKTQSSYYKNILKIKEWMEKNRTTTPPSQRANEVEERKLGNALNKIRRRIKEYNALKTEEEKEEFKINNPEIEDVIEMVQEIEMNNIKDIKPKEESSYYKNALKIRVWMNKNERVKPPSQTASEKEEKNLAYALSDIRSKLINPYIKMESEEKKEEYERNHPELKEVMKIIEEIDRNNIPIIEEQTYYKNILAIQKWMKLNKTTNLPRAGTTADDLDEEERKLGIALSTIRQNLIKPYQELKSEEEKEKYKRKYPEVEIVIKMVDEMDKNSNPYYKNILEIQKWMKLNQTTKPPSQHAKDEKERKLGQALRSIRKKINSLENERELSNNPVFNEIAKIVKEIDENNVPKYLKNMLEIKNWMEEHKTNQLPRSQYKDRNGKKVIPIEEEKMYNKLNHIRYLLIKPYLELQTEKEREEYKIKHPELEEVMAILEELENNKTKGCIKKIVIEQKNKGLLGENYEKNPEASDKIFDETFKQVEQFKENEDGER